LQKFKDAALSQDRFKFRGQWRHPKLFVDFSKVREMSVPVAVIIAAELDRWSRIRKTQLRTRNSKRWQPRVRQLLDRIGAFELLGIRKVVEETEMYSNELFILKIRSGEKSDNEKVGKLQEDLAKIGTATPRFTPKPYVFEGLSEAVLNCIDHAYLATKDEKPKYPYAGHRWWASACVDPDKRSLRFFIYDQGVGIPATIKNKRGWRDEIAKRFKSAGFLTSHANVIEGAIEVGRTRTDQDGRGKGLGQMVDVIAKAGAGSIRIVSGHGDVTVDPQGKVKKTKLSSHIGGTLIEWSIPFDAFN
jgi:hypothetical protein